MIPLGSSQYQIENIITHEPPARKRRQILLQMNQIDNALKECEFRRRKLDIDKRVIEEKINSSFGVAREYAMLELEQLQDSLQREEKYIEDALVEYSIYKRLLDDMPDYTREEFEALEAEYWHDRFLNDARCEYISTGTVSVGTIQALEKIGIEVRRQDGKLQISQDGKSLLTWNM